MVSLLVLEDKDNAVTAVVQSNGLSNGIHARCSRVIDMGIFSY
jgi:hypothetical protein